MKYLFLLWIPMVYAMSKEFEAPVARRDADMCAVYLCPSLPDHAVSYLQMGCQGTFTKWIEDTVSQTPQTILIETTDHLTPCVHWSSLLILATLSTVVSFYIGWKEHKNQYKSHSQ
jgi:hypothetical protein